MPADVDVVVIGAGVIGLAIAREFANTGQSVIVIEKAAAIGTETSSRSSEVIHAGIYYPTASLKARLCVEGRNLLYAFCASHAVATRRLGKLIVATSASEEEKLKSIATQARANGVDDLQWLSASDVANIEEELNCTAALLSPSTGILDVPQFMLALQASAENRGTSIAFQTAFSAAKRSGDLFQVSTTGANGEAATLTCKTLINAAGHGAHSAASAIETFPQSLLPPRYLAKGSYCSLSGPSPFQHLVYPVPVSGALGIHATLDIEGNTRFGPDIEWVQHLDYDMQEGLPSKFTKAIAPYWPGIKTRTLQPSYCGIRPKIHGPDKNFADFLIQTENQHGINGLVNLFGIESPGITASLAIAKYVIEATTKKQ